MCLDAAMSTEEVGIGSPEASTGVLLADISAGVVGARRGDLGGGGGERAKEEDRRWRERGGWGPEEQVRCVPHSSRYVVRGLWTSALEGFIGLVCLGL
jgi:hypothetical protein